MDQSTAPRRRRWWYLLLLIPLVATLWVPFYAGASPALAGFPYFYWYQLLWVLISAGLTAVVYIATRGNGENRRGDL